MTAAGAVALAVLALAVVAAVLADGVVPVFLRAMILPSPARRSPASPGCGLTVPIALRLPARDADPIARRTARDAGLKRLLNNLLALQKILH